MSWGVANKKSFTHDIKHNLSDRLESSLTEIQYFQYFKITTLLKRS